MRVLNNSSIPEPPPLNEENLLRYAENPILFRKEQWVMPQTREHPHGCLFGDVCEDWQIEKIFDPIDRIDDEGQPFYKLLYIQLCKKMGKTSVLSGECITQLFLSPFPSEENYLLAGDKDQAAYLFKHTVGFIRRNPNLDAIFSIYRDELVLDSTGSRLVVLSSEAATKHGKNPDFFIFDEFWNQPNRALWDSMWLGLAAKPHGKGVIITNAGFDLDSICYEVRNFCKSHEFEDFYYYEPIGEELKSIQAPWITEKWVAKERATTPANVFRRFRENLWIPGGDAPFMPDEGWGCFQAGLHEKIDCAEGAHVVGIDYGKSHDAAGAIVLHREMGKIVIDQIRSWKGSNKVNVPIEEIKSYLKTVIANFFDVTIIADPWQMVGTMQEFKSSDIRVIEGFHTVQNIVKWSKNLYYLFKNVAILSPRHTILEKELKGLQIVDKSYGWRIDHEAKGASDLSIALAMASYVAMQKGIEEGELDMASLKNLQFHDQSAVYKSTGSRTYVHGRNEDTDMVDDTPRIGRIF